jgi:TolB protein
MVFSRPITFGAICLPVIGFSVSGQSPTASGSLNADPAEIAFASHQDGNWEIYVMDAAGRNQRRLTRRDVQDRFPVWSPDAAQIAFGSQVGEGWELWVMDANGARQRHLYSGIVPKSPRGWSRDGRRIAFTAVADGNVDVYAVIVESAQVTHRR